MRIEPFQQAGYFWLPEAPETKLPGTLHVEAGGRIELEVVGFSNRLAPQAQPENGVIRIVGVTEKGKTVTLDRCFETAGTAASGGLSKTRFFVHMLIEGLAFGADEPLLFERFTFLVDGLHDWFSSTGFEMSHDFTANTYRYEYQPPEELTFDLAPDIIGGLGFSSTLPGRPIDGILTVREKACFSMSPAEPLPLNELTKAAQRLVHFYCFALDQTVSINTVRARSPLEQVENRDATDTHGPWVTLIYQSLPYSERVPRHVQNTMLFRFPQIQERIDDIFSRWMSAYDVLQPALDLYFSVRTGAYRYTEGRFLSLAQALETLHRRTCDDTPLSEKDFADRVDGILDACPSEWTGWLRERLCYANSLPLRKRVKLMLEPFADLFGSKADRAAFVRNVVDWRNYLTHYDTGSRKAGADHGELFPLCMKMEALLQCHWLRMIGFSDQAVVDTVAKSPSLQNKLVGRPGYNP